MNLGFGIVYGFVFGVTTDYYDDDKTVISIRIFLGILFIEILYNE